MLQAMCRATVILVHERIASRSNVWIEQPFELANDGHGRFYSR